MHKALERSRDAVKKLRKVTGADPVFAITSGLVDKTMTEVDNAERDIKKAIDDGVDKNKLKFENKSETVDSVMEYWKEEATKLKTNAMKARAAAEKRA